MRKLISASRRQVLMGSGAVVALAGLGPALADVGPSDPMIEHLIASMTLEEKAGQLTMEGALSATLETSDFFAANPAARAAARSDLAGRFAAQIERARTGAVGFLLGPGNLSDIRAAQTAAARASRLKIPMMFCSDVIHGFRTVFPVGLAEAASWEPDLARRTARAAALEASAAGVDMTFAPMVDVGRDQRWGRVVEGAGEDTFLGARFAAARVEGFQGGLGAADSLVACPKHFAAYGAAEGGLDYNGAAISERVLREVYLPPFEAAYRAGALATMASFNTIDGVPSTGNPHLLTDILRHELGFAGVVISDYEGERELIAHGVAADDADAARLALTAGCDVGMVSGIYYQHLPGLVRSGVLPLSALDEAVRRVLWVKKRAGLFADPFVRIDEARYVSRAADADHQALAREAARKSIVLLRNQGSLLPLDPATARIALIGPCADDREVRNVNGPWTLLSTAATPITLAEGVGRAIGDPARLTVTTGCDHNAPLAGGIEAAMAAALAADVVLLAVGETEMMSGESASRAEIVLPAPQQALAEALATSGKPLVVILRHGRALALEGAARAAPAILATWFLGSQTGPAIADILFGAAQPSGRLPVSFPNSPGQEPLYYDHEVSGRPAPAENPLERYKTHYLGLPYRALYPFGHGLSYSDVAYGEPSASAAVLPWDGAVEISATLRNTGTRPIWEVAQLYIHQSVASIAPPTRLLTGFQKIALDPGEAKRVSFRLSRTDLAFVRQDLTREAEPGRFQVWIAPNAEAGAPASFVLSAPKA